MDRLRFKTCGVVSLTEHGPLGDRFREFGVPVNALGMRRGVPDPRALRQLTGILRESRPDIVQTWMYHGDLMGALACARIGRIPIVWGVHHSNLDRGLNKRLTRLTARTCAHLSRLPAKIVCCSEASRRVHADLGYSEEKMTVIPNGVDTSVFRPSPAARSSVRQELMIPEDATLIGMAARYHPLKDHRTFVEAAGLFNRSSKGTHFLLCGDGLTRDNQELAGWIDREGLGACCHLLGPRNDVPRLMASLDMATLSSKGEAFPCVIVEAMACEVPCVVTDVGDSAAIVSDTGLAVPPGDPRALAEGWHRLLASGRRSQLGVAARQRVQEQYSASAIVARYEAVYRQVVEPRRDRESSPVLITTS
jgi:glycosyltransferase involved in cell wall biosynthesis